MTDSDGHEPIGDEPAGGQGNSSRPVGDSSDSDPRLTPGQLEAIRTAMLSPQFRDQLAKIARNASDLVRLPETYNRAIAESMRPATNALLRWQEQQKSLTSDIFKSLALTQANLDGIAAQLAKNADFTSISERFAAQQAEMWKRIAPTLQNVRAAFYPPNLRDIEGARFEQVEQVVMVDGIALYGVPRTKVAEALIRAEGAPERRVVLVSRWTEIAADCRDSLNSSTDADLADFVLSAQAALDALDAGHTNAAQALAASLLDAILRECIGGYKRLLPTKNGERPETYDKLSVRQSIALGPILQAYQRFFPEKNDPVPEVFNRHACAHTVSPLQYGRHNAIQGVMLVCSLLHFLDEWAASAAA